MNGHWEKGGPLERTEGREWRPSCPLPFYRRSWRTGFRWRFVCECGVEFRDEAVYRGHWRAAVDADLALDI